MAQTKFLIGNGESLVSDITANSGFSEKLHPYNFNARVLSLRPTIQKVVDEINTLPSEACPDDEAVIALTLHPTYLAKSYHPTAILNELGLRQVGSRESRIEPETAVRDRPATVTTELFIAGARGALQELLPVEGGKYSENFQNDFRKFETMRALGTERLRVASPTSEPVPLEIVLHTLGDGDRGERIYSGFEDWCAHVGVKILSERAVGGLSFINAYSDATKLEQLIKFPFLRLVRRMPKLAFRSVPFRTVQLDEKFQVSVTHNQPVSQQARVAVFDGGLPIQHPFGPLVRPLAPNDIGAPHPHGLEHGVQVTSAALFGPIEEGVPLEQPFGPVDHWRIVDNSRDDFELTQTLDHIINVLETGDYDIANLSLGPDIPLDDDDVHIWTSSMDSIAAKNKTVIVSAAGNNGLDDAAAGNNRVQPSSDGVNVLAVGARDNMGSNWSRAEYSAIGPGRSPGRVKPDCVAFGGTDEDPFFALDIRGTASGTQGTSFAAPTVARLATGIKTNFGQLTPTAVRAILIHTARTNNCPREDVGWGSVEHNISEIIECANDEATVVFQGDLGLQSMRRYPIPCPSGGFKRQVQISATFVVASPVDPEDAVSYTQVGAHIFFRPNTTRAAGYTEKGKPKLHATKPFFGSSDHFQTEQELRDDAHRWEAVKRQTKTFNPSTLSAPVFDIQHHARSHGAGRRRLETVPYALIVTIREKNNNQLYEQVLADHLSLRAMVPDIQVSAS